MIANAIPAPAAAHVLIDRSKRKAANAACYAPQTLRAYRITLQQPRTRIRDSLAVLARGLGDALDCAEQARPGFLITGWRPV